jgi:hypothetical protein
MSQSAQAVETAVTAQSLLGSQDVTFPFPSDKTSTRTVRRTLDLPNGNVSTTLIALKGFNVGYVDEDYELENIQVSLSVEGKTAICTATLRDRNEDVREWQGTIVGLVTFFGKA